MNVIARHEACFAVSPVRRVLRNLASFLGAATIFVARDAEGPGCVQWLLSTIPAPAGPSTLSVFENTEDGGCRWLQADPGVADKELFRFPQPCRLKTSFSHDRTKVLIFMVEGDSPTFIVRVFEAHISRGLIRAIPILDGSTDDAFYGEGDQIRLVRYVDPVLLPWWRVPVVDCIWGAREVWAFSNGSFERREVTPYDCYSDGPREIYARFLLRNGADLEGTSAQNYLATRPVRANSTLGAVLAAGCPDPYFGWRSATHGALEIATSDVSFGVSCIAVVDGATSLIAYRSETYLTLATTSERLLVTTQAQSRRAIDARLFDLRTGEEIVRREAARVDLWPETRLEP